jgi:hypothetical protein
MSELMIKGQVFKMRTLYDLVLMVVRLRYENGLDDKIRRKIILAGQILQRYTPKRSGCIKVGQG